MLFQYWRIKDINLMQKFFYLDFRPGFYYGQRLAKEIGLYRQKYCGCIFSLDESDFKEKIIKSFES